jgi:hypothetical protein
MSEKPRLCPQIGKPCIRERCEAWYEGIVEEHTPTGPVPVAKSACMLYFWTPIFLKGIANRADGTQRAIESMRNEEVRGLGILTQTIHAIGEGQRRLK